MEQDWLLSGPILDERLTPNPYLPAFPNLPPVYRGGDFRPRVSGRPVCLAMIQKPVELLQGRLVEGPWRPLEQLVGEIKSVGCVLELLESHVGFA